MTRYIINGSISECPEPKPESKKDEGSCALAGAVCLGILGLCTGGVGSALAGAIIGGGIGAACDAEKKK
jgi:outer membrane lipoprotein SlyB